MQCHFIPSYDMPRYVVSNRVICCHLSVYSKILRFNSSADMKLKKTSSFLSCFHIRDNFVFGNRSDTFAFNKKKQTNENRRGGSFRFHVYLHICIIICWCWCDGTRRKCVRCTFDIRLSAWYTPSLVG